MRWGLYNDNGMRDTATGLLVYFGHTSDDLLFGMAGSASNIEGSMYGMTSTSSRSVTPYVVDFLLNSMDSGERPERFADIRDGETQQVYNGIAAANHYLPGPIQSMEFVAKVLARDEHCRLRPLREDCGLGLLATPLYVVQTSPMSEDEDKDADKLVSCPNGSHVKSSWVSVPSKMKGI